MSLSSWDVGSVINLESNLHKLRRNSYVLATHGRRRLSSFQASVFRRVRHNFNEDELSGTVSSATGGEEVKYLQDAFHNRNEIWRLASENPACRHSPQVPEAASCPNVSQQHRHNIVITLNDEPIELIKTQCMLPTCRKQPSERLSGCISMWPRKIDLFTLSIGFVLIYSAFRSIQNLQSTLFGSTGTWAMFILYFAMFGSSTFVSRLAAQLGTKCSMLLGIFSYLIWFTANLFPSLPTLLTTSALVGFGQSIAWNAQLALISTLLRERHTALCEDGPQSFKFNTVFLACFQTTHIWGNLMSSLILGGTKAPSNLAATFSTMRLITANTTAAWNNNYSHSHSNAGLCGKFDCSSTAPIDSYVYGYSALVWSHLGIGIVGFGMVCWICLLRRIDVTSADMPSQPEVSPENWRHVSQARVFRLLIPLLVFNGFEQAFVYADFNKSFIACPLGLGYIGWSMILLGLANTICSVAVGILAERMPREAIMGLAALLHVALLVFLLIWDPKTQYVTVLLAMATLWGVCDSVWQTQCNALIGIGCSVDSETVFNNFRTVQALGASLAFGLSNLICIDVKMYLLLILLLLSMIGYVMAEHEIRKHLTHQDAPTSLHTSVTEVWLSEPSTYTRPRFCGKQISKEDQVNSLRCCRQMHSTINASYPPLSAVNKVKEPHLCAYRPIPPTTFATFLQNQDIDRSIIIVETSQLDKC